MYWISPNMLRLNFFKKGWFWPNLLRLNLPPSVVILAQPAPLEPSPIGCFWSNLFLHLFTFKTPIL